LRGATTRRVSALRWCGRAAVKRGRRKERVNEGVKKTEGPGEWRSKENSEGANGREDGI